MPYRFLNTLLTGLFSLSGAFACTVYDNTTGDTGHSFIFSNDVILIGDQVHRVDPWMGNLPAYLRLHASPTAIGTPAVRLWFFEPGDAGSPIGAPVGGPYWNYNTRTIDADSINVWFTIPAIPLPHDFVFLAAVYGASQRSSFGLELFNPPHVGSSDNSWLIVGKDFGDLHREYTDFGNVYFHLGVPEPPTFLLLGIGLVAAGLVRVPHSRRCRP